MPIPGATVRIKGTASATTANNKGEYNIKANQNNDLLQVSSVGFDTKEIKLSGLKIYDVILSRSITFLSGEVVVVGGVFSSDGDYSTPVDPKHIAVLEVKDNVTMRPVKASVVIESTGYHNIDSATTDKKGLYKIKKIREYETYTVKIKADGYIDQELQIKGSDFEQRKITKQIFLEKAPVLSDYKKMEEVVVVSDFTKRMGGMMGAMVFSSVQIKRTYMDTLKLITTKITGDLKIYPNPVQKGNSINIALKLQHTGTCNIQVIDAAGNIVLQKQSTATAKQYIEQVQTGDSWSSGVYYVRIFDSNNKMVSTSNFLIQ
jgi:ribulose 1,5-bisphosphate synthetase/thiazole synthase